ncbi:MAG: SMI1/KNR4 family protein [Leptolyngbyaceae cyanobacterium]
MEETLTSIKNWLATHSPQTLAHLNPPASEDQINAVEAEIGLPLPPDVQQFLRFHDGEDGETWLAFLGDGNQLLSCQAIIDQYQLDQEIGQAVYDPEMEAIAFWQDRVANHVIYIEGTVKPLMLHPQWIPLTCMNGDVFRYIDLDPAPGGTPGQIIEVDPEGCCYQVLAPSFAELLEKYLTQLLGGTFNVEEDGFIASRGENNLEWHMPEWLRHAQ